MSNNVRIETGWKNALNDEWNKPYFMDLTRFVKESYAHGIIYPPGKQIFAAFDNTPYEQVKVVILGQDPYHGEGQANGLCFSVGKDVTLPPSLVNIFKEISSDLNIPVSSDGDLSRWARQGVLLLNSTLTVEAHKPGSHQGKGWEIFTDSVIRKLNEEREHIVFILWGSYAINKGSLIDRSKHLVLQSPHPSPLSAHRGFFGNHHFSATNDYLIKYGKTPIDWR